MAYSSLSDLVKHYESGGNYTAKNPTSTASGAYQFTNGTWAQYASQSGVSTAQYPTAASAPPAVQDAVFNTAVQKNGLGDWTCAGCNPALTSYVQSNDVSQLPIAGGAGQLDSGAMPQGGYGSNGAGNGYPATTEASWITPSTLAGSGGASSASGAATTAEASIPGVLLNLPFSFGLSAGLASAVNSWITNLETLTGNAFKSAFGGLLTTAENLALRGVIVILAIGLILFALWRLTDSDGSKTRAVLKSAAA